MKTNCEIHNYLLENAMTINDPLGNHPGNEDTFSGTHPLIQCNQDCRACCLMLILQFLCIDCKDPMAFISDARVILEKYHG